MLATLRRTVLVDRNAGVFITVFPASSKALEKQKLALTYARRIDGLLHRSG
jgi:hypothetical protein